MSFERSSCYTCKAELRVKKPEPCAGPWVYNYLASETWGYGYLVLFYDLQSSRPQMLCIYIQSYTHANVGSVHVCSHTHIEREGDLQMRLTDEHSQMRVFVGPWWECPMVYSKNTVIRVGTIDWKSHSQRTVMAVSKVMSEQEGWHVQVALWFKFQFLGFNNNRWRSKRCSYHSIF